MSGKDGIVSVHRTSWFRTAAFGSALVAVAATGVSPVAAQVSATTTSTVPTGPTTSVTWQSHVVDGNGVLQPDAQQPDTRTATTLLRAPVSTTPTPRPARSPRRTRPAKTVTLKPVAAAAAVALTTTSSLVPAPTIPAANADDRPAGARRPEDDPEVWRKLRVCESGDRYELNTGNGFYGAYQFAAGTWNKLGYPGLPHQASPAVQDEAAKRLQATAGWSPWPACSRKLGLR